MCPRRASRARSNAPFDKRADYINHGPDSAGIPSENLLLFAAEIGTPNQNIPPQLEAIDCPGLGSKHTIDTVMTKEFLPHLDGALIFLRADQLRSKDVVEILEVLKTNFGRLEGRVWIVVNKFDVLTKEPLYGDANGQTVFDLIRLFNADYGIPAEQIVFTSKAAFTNFPRMQGARLHWSGPPSAWACHRRIRFRRAARWTAYSPPRFNICSTTAASPTCVS